MIVQTYTLNLINGRTFFNQIMKTGDNYHQNFFSKDRPSINRIKSSNGEDDGSINLKHINQLTKLSEIRLILFLVKISMLILS